jgi:aspartyl/asparaginyl-tRNA synthetase
VQVKGWVRTKRGNKNIAFIALNDGSTIHNVQIVCDMAVFTEEQLRPLLPEPVSVLKESWSPRSGHNKR